jgi:hypothetical protein
MKTRKILALVMAIALLAVSMTVVASAEEERPTSAYTIYIQPTKINYTDAECFDATGLIISDGYTDIYYDTDYQYFTFTTEKTETLTVYMTEIEVFYKGESCGFVTVTVSHAGGEIVPVNNHHHGQICSACGVICYNTEHDVPYWVPNGDASLVRGETETGTCTTCGDTVSQIIPGTATYATIFADIDILAALLALVTMIVEGFAII